MPGNKSGARIQLPDFIHAPSLAVELFAFLVGEIQTKNIQQGTDVLDDEFVEEESNDGVQDEKRKEHGTEYGKGKFTDTAQPFPHGDADADHAAYLIRLLEKSSCPAIFFDNASGCVLRPAVAVKTGCIIADRTEFYKIRFSCNRADSLPGFGLGVIVEIADHFLFPLVCLKFRVLGIDVYPAVGNIRQVFLEFFHDHTAYVGSGHGLDDKTVMPQQVIHLWPQDLLHIGAIGIHRRHNKLGLVQSLLLQTFFLLRINNSGPEKTEEKKNAGQADQKFPLRPGWLDVTQHFL